MFDLTTKFGTLTREEGRVFKGAGPSVPRLFRPPTYAHTV